ncbi:MAG: Fic family protein [Alistipes sp.]|nr:Fic family protein [Alistipes sp.]
MLEFNYNSNRIEGNTLTYGQTRLLFLFGTTSDGVPLRDYEEMKAHNVGLELVKREAADRERPLTEQFIRQLNRTILVEDFYKTQKDAAGEIRRYEVKVGQYKTRPNSVITATGEVFDYASPEETSALMTDLTAWYNEQEAKGELSPIELATLFHYRYIRIHPFEDGNGRIARLLVNYILLRHDYPMIIVRSDDKKNYLNVLHKCDVEVGLRPSDGASAQIEQVEPFVVYVKTLAERALNIAIRAGKGESIEDIDDFAKRIALLEREAKNKKGRAKFSETEVWDVLEFLYFPVKNRIDEALKPAMSFFSTVDEFSTINKSKYYKFAGVGEHLIYNADRNYSDVEMDDFISNAKYVHLSIYLEHPKREYSLGNLDIKINFVVEFEDSYYTINSLNNKQFSYGTYPSEEEIGQIVSGYKTDVLNKIEKAIQNRK